MGNVPRFPVTGEETGGLFDPAVDNPATFPQDYRDMQADLQSVMDEIAERCYCELCE